MASKADTPEGRAEKLGYQRGYNAGRKRTEEDVRAMSVRRARAVRRDAFLCAAMTGFLAGPAPWRTDGTPWSTMREYADAAGEMADLMLKNAEAAERR